MDKLFEEWTEYAIEKELKDRDISHNLLEMAEKKIIFINGIRRSGKSSLLILLMKNLPEKSAYINLEDERIPHDTTSLDAIVRWFGDKGYLFLDEITSMQGWERWLARIHEQTKGKLKIIAASSIRTVTNLSKPLRGRVLEYEFFPLSFKEFLAFTNVHIKRTTAGEGIIRRELEKYLTFGGFPEVAQSENDTEKTLILLSYYRDIVALDIAEKSKTNLSFVNMVARYLINSTVFSASKCSNFLKSVGIKTGKEKILELERISELSYLFFFIPIFSFNVKDRFQYPRKVYPGDTGFINSVSKEMGMGRLYENAVFLSLRRNLKPDEEINHWKDREGYEVDFVIRKGLKVENIIQVSMGVDIKDREFRAGIKAAKEFKKNEVILIGDKDGEEQRDGVTFKFIPLLRWLLPVQ